MLQKITLIGPTQVVVRAELYVEHNTNEQFKIKPQTQENKKHIITSGENSF